ncbi:MULTISPECIES: ABC transporter ATP-binding protein [unclassified Mesorhizobium]|uniref:ABC transporter ATP-binding protein n=1 Tax=unclassified Mesorhizobium TaxID=325217 RepID=UPI001127109B|nr:MULTISPECIES: ABC transporter ATP-binding protein [unclassified Mesorhizobium]MCA0060175.1 ABC transporter ATP-binding protein [Mesorhizobium sp. B261B1A]TPI51977.1 ABC transporter ATP-binding protein [Mesorhizobium sp. B3-1-1]TPJ63333.1 ABC transporter ATP-binding protein [Mesorhizobium sp. B2-6-7]TPJ83574.1 ABC transporter ATP-binding protein [Mesorhizobium sp. B2-6-3]TPJ94704.1 ABC transporter ATP-binding protein [Mesorhizobium sp. B2-5-10]
MDQTAKNAAPGVVDRPAVRFEGVTKKYGAVTAVDNVSFDIAPASLVTLLGPSGCGKTTTLRLIAGLEHASHGRVVIDGKDVTLLSAAERDVSMVFQSYALFPHMNVIENVSYGLRATGLGKVEAAGRAAEKLAQVGLSGYEKRQPSELSGGQQQRVAVARAIVLEPKVLLFDEPLSNLDAKLRRRVRDEIRGLQQDLALTVVYVTHDQEEALAVSDRIIVMNAARVAQDGTPRDLYNEPRNSFIADFMGDANLLDVEVLASNGTNAEVKIGPLRLDMPHRGIAAGPAVLAVRPNAVRLVAGQPAAGGMRGRVVKSSYLGDHMEYRVAINDPAVELFATSPIVTPALPEGSVVAVDFDPAKIVLIARDKS